jgi:uncharacterized protein (DUF1697 family)
MQRFVAFLGGINVGGHRVKGPELAAEFTALGFTDVATFLASGNVVFSTEDTLVAELTAGIEKQLEAALGYAVPTYLRTADQVRHIAAHQPFPAADIAASRGKVQVALLAEPPAAAAQATARELSSDQDRLAVDGTELYWLPSGGVSESELDLRTLFAALGPSTLRTVNTMRRITTRYLTD